MTPANKAPEAPDKLFIVKTKYGDYLAHLNPWNSAYGGGESVPYVPLSRVEALEARVKELEGALRRCRKQAVEKISFRAAREAE